MRTILLTLDYELYGNGSGDVFNHIIEPTKQLLTIADTYGVKYTIFFEVIEYWKIKEEWDKGNTMGYKEDPVFAIENQIRDAYRQGHDVQLHIHPQWVDAYWHNGRWIVNLEKWRLGSYVGEDENSLVNLLKRSKQTLEKLLRPVNPNYRCIAMRAGGYNIQPSERIVEAMKEVGLIIDSSIYPGGKENGLLSNYDYSAIDSTNGMWRVGERLEDSGSNDIWELPIVAFPMVRIKKFLTWERLRGFLQNSQSAKESLDAKTSTTEKKSSKLDKLRYFFKTEWQTWDFCLFSPSQHKQFLKKITKLNRDKFVLVGHPKSFSGCRGLKYLLKNTFGKYEYKTVTGIAYNKN